MTEDCTYETHWPDLAHAESARNRSRLLNPSLCRSLATGTFDLSWFEPDPR